MRSEDFAPTSPGTLVSTADGALAFLPAPLPRDLSLSSGTVRRVGHARARLGTLVEGVRSLPAPDLLIQPFQKREAVLSSRIEGTRTTLDDAFLEDETEDVDDDALEVRNYERALRAGVLALASGQPLSTHLLRALHRELLTGARGQDKRPGELRSQQVWLASPDVGDVRSARFVPPPPEHVPACLDGFAEYLSRPSDDDPLIRVALAHYQFETIHPFLDGNGRIGRLLIALQMIAEGLLEQPWLYISPALERQRDHYYRGLHTVSTHGAFEAWIDFFLDAVVTSADETIDRLHHLRDLERDFQERLRDVQSQKPAQLLPQLFANPFLTVPTATRHLGATPRTAQQAIDKLVEAGILVRDERTVRRGRGRPAQLYRCVEVQQIVRE